MGLGLYRQVMAAPSCCPGLGRGFAGCYQVSGCLSPCETMEKSPSRSPGGPGGCVATLVRSPPEHLCLAVLLSGPLLPPSHGTALSCVPWIATAAVQFSCALDPGAIHFSSSQSWGKDLGFQRCCELSVSLGKC